MNDAMQVLIIDDSDDDREMYRRALQKNTEANYSIFEAADGEKGLAHIVKEQPACILLDYSLPGHNGIEVLKQIRNSYRFIPVVMLTGQGNENVAVAAMQEGAQNYIAKANITPESLQRVIQAAMDNCALHKRIHEQRTSLEIFTRALAHDLKEPVRTIQSFMTLLAPHQGFSEKEKGYFDYIQKAAIRMAALIETVFFYTQLDSVEKEISKGICDTGKILGEVQENLHELIKERGATISCDSLPKISANRTQMLQVLQNLVCNAIRHCIDTPRIHLFAQEQEHHWLFSVKDNGPGIKPEHGEKIFEPFKRMAHHKEQGLGLGLAICRKIIESHGGKIWYEPSPQAGATFLFTLPKLPADTKTAGATPPAASFHKEPDDVVSQELGTILLVEDNEADIELARVMLIEEAGLQCHLLIARDGYEALIMMYSQIVKNHAVDLLLLDINMPGMGGFELLERMRQENRLQKIPVVMCTTSTYGKDMETALSLGARGYLTKPAGLDKLKAVLDGISTITLCRKGDGYALQRAA